MRKRVVIIGGGFGGLNAAKTFNNKNFDVILVDKTNHHLFQPLLYQVATAALSPGNIARPIRAILSNQANVQVILDEVVDINKENNFITLKSEGKLSFDYLIIAVGARHSYFGHDEWEQFAPGLKTLNDALTIREKVLLSFEKAEITENKHDREKYLNFVIVGGGPTGVEMAGAIAEIARKTMSHDFRHIDPWNAKILLVEGSDKLVRSFAPKLTDYTKRTLEKMGVHVWLDKVVTEVTAEGVKIGDEFIPTTNVIWAAGNTASPLLKTLNTELDRAGRAVVNSDLSIPGFTHIFVIGDASNVKDEKGNPLPALAPVANQQGIYVANVIIDNKAQREQFKYFDKGSMATIGKAKAIAQIKEAKFTGFIAWLMWTFVHVMFLIGFRNKIAVMLEWLWLYISNQRAARLIVRSNNETSKEVVEKAKAF